MMRERGKRVYVEGDGADICTADYKCHISSWATVIDAPDPDNEYILLSIDRVGSDRDAWVYVKKTAVRTTEDANDAGRF